MKKVVIILGVLVVVVILAVIAVTVSLGSIVKKGVETVGPRVTKVEVKLDSASLSVLSGSGTLKGLFVGNPPGFNSPSAIKAGELSVAVQPSSVFSDKVVVRSVRVIAPEITLHGLQGDNLKKILENVQGPAGAEPAAKKPETAEGKRVQVDDLLIQNGKVNLVLPVVGTTSLSLPDIHLVNLGNDSKGLSAPELSAKVVKAILDAAVAVAASAGKDIGKVPEAATKEAGKQLDKALKGAGKLFK